MKLIKIIIGILILASCQKNDVINQIVANKEFNITIQCENQVEIYNSCAQKSEYYEAGTKNIRIVTGYTLNTGTIHNTKIVDLMGSKRKYTKQTNKLANKMVLICDSIGVGQAATNYNYTSWSAKMIYQGLCDTTYLGYGWGKIAAFAGDSTKLADTIAKITAVYSSLILSS